MYSKIVQIVVIFCLFGIGIGNAQFSVKLPDREITAGIEYGKTVFNGAQLDGKPGQPLLPVYKLSFILPPGVDPKNVSVSIVDPTEEQLNGTYSIDPALPPFSNNELLWPIGKNIRNGMDMDVYDKDAFFPADYINGVSFGKMRQYQLVDVIVGQFRYNPVTRTLKKITGGTLMIKLPKGAYTPPQTIQKSLNQQSEDYSEKFLKNYTVNPEILGSYTANTNTLGGPPPKGYIIITTQAIVNGAATQLQNLTNQKTAKGYNVIRATENIWGGGTGDVAAEHIRSYLQSLIRGGTYVYYVLLIGNPNPLTGDVPMKMLWPRYAENVYPEVPTDYYYAELTEGNDWDVNDNGYLGEDVYDFGQPGGPDQYPDVAVGRIPYYGNMTDLNKILAKSIGYENATSRGWRKSVLIPTEPSNEKTPGYPLGEAINNDYLIPDNWDAFRIYDKENLYTNRYLDEVLTMSPPPERVDCSENNVQDIWSKNPFGLVLWFTHGLETVAFDIFSSPRAASLNDAYPSMTFQASCLNAHPETVDNLAYSLLRNGAVTTIGATRVSYFWTEETQFLNSGSNAGMAYAYGLQMERYGSSAGEALNGVKSTISNHLIWANFLVFNLYGCPDLTLNVDVNAPCGLNARALSPSTVNLGWKNNSDYLTGIRIERGTVNGNFSQIATLDPSATSYDDQNLAANTKYYYRIRAFSSEMQTDYTNIDSAKTFTNIASGKPATASSQYSSTYSPDKGNDNSTTTRWRASSYTAPQWWKVDLGGRFQLSGSEIMWEKSGVVYKYTIEMSDDNSTWYTVVDLTNNTSTAQTQRSEFSNWSARYIRITITGLSANTAASFYEFRVFGEVTPSEPIITNVTSVPCDQLQFSWQSSGGASSYNVIQAAHSFYSRRWIVGSGVTNTSFTTTGLRGETSYAFSIVAVNSAGQSYLYPGSNGQSYMANATAPVAMGNITIAPSNGFCISWADNATNETGYKIERAPTGTTTWNTIATIPQNRVDYTDGSANGSTSYQYRVCAFNSVGNSSYSNIVNTNIPPGLPSLYTPDYSSSKVNLRWNYYGNTQTGFKLERSTNGTSYSLIATLDPTVRDYNDAGAQLDCFYYYRLYAYNNYGNSEYSIKSIQTPPGAPTNLTASLVSGAVRLNWIDKSTTEEQFVIYRNGDKVITVNANITEYLDYDITPSTAYFYIVAARNPGSLSDWSNEVTITTTTTPSSPSNLTATVNSRSQITINWTDNASGESGFYIERAPSGGSFTQIASVGANVVSYSNSGLTAGTTYQYRVRAYNSNGNSAYSNTVTAATFANLALSMTVTSSSQQSGNERTKANDNSTSSRWAASSGTMPQWWKVDLGSSKSIKEVEIMFERTGSGSDCNDFTIETSTNNSTWTQQVNRSSNTNTAQTQAYSFNATARYVRITISDAPGSYYASMYEFRVFGQ